MATTPNPTKTLVVDNFSGSMTIRLNGDINSGHSWEQTCSGQNPFLKPGQLTWCRNAVQIDSAGSVITDLIVMAKERVESGILYVYAVGHTGRVYKIQVNDPTTYNPTTIIRYSLPRSRCKAPRLSTAVRWNSMGQPKRCISAMTRE
jgi:hypothetical protein